MYNGLSEMHLIKFKIVLFYLFKQCTCYIINFRYTFIHILHSSPAMSDQTNWLKYATQHKLHQWWKNSYFNQKGWIFPRNDEIAVSFDVHTKYINPILGIRVCLMTLIIYNSMNSIIFIFYDVYKFKLSYTDE